MYPYQSKTVSEEDKEKLISQGLSTSTVMKAFVLPCALKKYLWYDYALKEKKA